MKPAFLVLAATLLVLAACGEKPSGPAVADDPVSGPPSAVPGGLVQTVGPVTVLDDGDGAELCLGGVATSLPPQCGGPRLAGWNWAELDGHYEEASGVRWGGFHVIGTYVNGGRDGTFTAQEVTPASEWDGERPSYDRDVTTPCAEPDGGWQVVDPALTTMKAREEVFRAAQQLDGYAGGWVDQSINPASARLDDPDHEVTAQDEPAMNDPALTVVNVRVVGDVAAAEAELREVWGGPLCVSQAERSDAELRSILDEVTDRPDLLGAGIDITTGTVELTVIHDDGTLQTALDDAYGAGVVRVDSALGPVV